MDPSCLFRPSFHHFLGNSPETRSVASSETLSDYDGCLWECIGRRTGDHGGHILTYRIKDWVSPACLFSYALPNDRFYPVIEPFPSQAFDRLSSAKSYPALEPSPLDAFELLCDDKSAEQAPEPMKTLLKRVISQIYESDDRRQACRTLGFYSYVAEDRSYIIETPDRAELLGGWAFLKARDPSLPDLKVANSQGIAGDMEFLSMVLEYGLLTSEGIESFHDMMKHVLPTIQLIFSEKDKEKRAQRYEMENERFSGVVRPIFQQLAAVREKLSQDEPHSYSFSLKDLEKVEAALSLFVDGWLATCKYEGQNSREEHKIQPNWGEADQRYMWAYPGIQYFWKRRFSDEPYNMASINRVQEVWREVYRLSLTG